MLLIFRCYTWHEEKKFSLQSFRCDFNGGKNTEGEILNLQQRNLNLIKRKYQNIPQIASIVQRNAQKNFL